MHQGSHKHWTAQKMSKRKIHAPVHSLWRRVCAGTTLVTVIDIPAVWQTEFSHESAVSVEQHHTLSWAEMHNLDSYKRYRQKIFDVFCVFIDQYYSSIIQVINGSLRSFWKCHQTHSSSSLSLNIRLFFFFSSSSSCVSAPPITRLCVQSSAFTATGHIPSLALTVASIKIQRPDNVSLSTPLSLSLHQPNEETD